MVKIDLENDLENFLSKKYPLLLRSRPNSELVMCLEVLFSDSIIPRVNYSKSQFEYLLSAFGQDFRI